MLNVKSSKMTVYSRVRKAFRPREIFLKDGAALKRIQISSQLQVAAVSVSALAALGLSLGALQISSGASMATSSFSSFSAQHASVAKMEARVAALQAEVETIRAGAKAHAAKIDQQDALLTAMLTGKGDAVKLSSLQTDAPRATTKLASDVQAPLTAVEQKQAALAALAQRMFETKIQKTESVIGHLGLASTRFHRVAGGMGGPYEPIDENANAAGDKNFRTLFQSWKKLDQLQQGVVAIPAIRPVDALNFTSNFGVRSDPFNGHRAMHAGVDIPGAHGTNIYATADGVVNRAGWVGGYGNLVELDHGRGIMTRYGHLSSFVVAPGARVTRGQLIAHMGSTGRSTGTHLHYEVRIDGNAVNPVPFLQSTDYLATLKSAPAAKTAMGGPESDD
jgi:murein DD-endopeptidase MepM/ murein hydrolase activator NlpD